MALLQTSMGWEFPATTSTGALKAYNLKGYSQQISFYAEAGPGCTATLRLETRAGSSAGPYVNLTTTALNLDTSGITVVQFVGPMEWVRPYCTAKTTGTLTVRLLGN